MKSAVLPAPSSAEASGESAAFNRHFRETVLPLWVMKDINPSLCLFWERFDFEGRPIRGVPHRFMVQAQQAATLAQADFDGEASAGERALRSFDRALAMFSDGGDLSRGLAFSLDSGGSIVDARRDAYTHAFALFSLAAVLRLSGGVRYRAAIEDLLGFVDGALVDPVSGRLVEGRTSLPGGRAQNPTMHLLQAYLALHEAWPERGFLDRAGRLVALAEDRLARNAADAVLEHYSSDWRPRPETLEGSYFEPGHQFERAWLVDRHARLAGEARRPICDRLWHTGVRYGFDNAGFHLDILGIDRKPRQRSRRLWPHFEAARAALVHPDHDGKAVLDGALRRLKRDLLSRPFAAGWVDRLDEEGGFAVDFVLASSFYHLCGAWAQLTERRRSSRPVQLAKDDPCQA